MEWGSLNLMATGLITFSIGKRPINLAADFLESVLRGKSRVESHTSCPS